MNEQELSSHPPQPLTNSDIGYMETMLVGSGKDAMRPQQWNDTDTYYQILLVTPPEKRTEGQYIKTTIVAKSREEFQTYLIDATTQEKLQPYYQNQNSNNIGSYLPSPGVVLAAGFLDALFSNTTSREQIIREVNNFYESTRTLLHSRKISQLIAKTWHSYLEAKRTGDWDKFVNGDWDEIDAEVLNNLIAREIFFVDQAYPPSDLEPENLDIYYPLQSKTKSSEKARFMILPSSKAWQGIALSLLMAGQAYREIKQDKETYYHQISQPILSTGEIVNRYGLEVEWNTFKGEIKELQLSPEKSSIAFQAVIPYPPIPSERNLSLNEIKKWADADDEEGELPFYSKENGEFLVDVKYFLSPYPYIPLSCC
ncbi:hypothetical protein [Anabaena azotica]|uniref:hypothetical protein n=1 Tax=Anabaena azotica TaxID=197653 RepID=UPI0039A60A8A